MNPSILTSTKKILGIEEDYTDFDLDIMTHINSALSVLTQLGLGPANGFMIEDAEPTWVTFLGQDPRLNAARTVVYMRVRLAFDPPATSFHIASLEKQIQELEWRLSVTRESVSWVDPNPSPTDPYSEPLRDLVIDGGVG